MPTRLGLYADSICAPGRVARAIDQIMTPLGPQASNTWLFKDAFFARDAEEMGFDLVQWYPHLVRDIIIRLAALQGIGNDPATGESPGQIHHEHRQLNSGGRMVGPESQVIFHQLCREFGLSAGSGKFTSYCSIDSTPNFVRLVWTYCQRYGYAILDELFVDKNGTTKSVAAAVLGAVAWIVSNLDASDIGLVEAGPRQQPGQGWPVMRDGSTSYLHADGTPAYYRGRLAPLEVQGLAYDALLMAGDLFADVTPSLKERWVGLAAGLQSNVLRRFWQGGYFAMALDRDERGQVRPLAVATSATAELLETRLFDNLSEEEQEHYVGSIVRLMSGSEFLTEVGIRMVALGQVGVTSYHTYQGPLTSWPVLTNKYARGLRHQRLPEIASWQEYLFTGGFDISGDYVEAWYVEADGTVIYFAQTDDPSCSWHLPATNLFERAQGWSITAAARAVNVRNQPVKVAARAAWKDLLTAEIDQQLRSGYTAYIDTAAGKRAEAEFLA